MFAVGKKKTARSEWLMRFYDWAIFRTWTLPKIEVTAGDTGMPSFSALEIFR